MLEQIKSANDRKFSDVKELQESKSPVIMYGAGSYALDVTHFLQKHSITIEAYCIDEAYMTAVAPKVNDHTVQSLESVLKRHPNCNIIIGFDNYVKARARLAELGFVERVYFIDAPNQYGFFNREYIVEHSDAFEETYKRLEDDKSREIFIDFINAKISGDPGALYKHADFNQYFSDPVTLSDHESFVDAGAYDGDTIASFLKNTSGAYEKIYAFEPDTKNFTKLQNYISDNKLERVELINAGCWSSATTLNFSSDANMASVEGVQGDTTIKTVRIDDAVGDHAVTYIKMDIEGAELEALKGAAYVIKRDHPKLAICAYHKPEDLITLPQYITKLFEGYKLYLRHHQFMSWEMVLYAIPGPE